MARSFLPDKDAALLAWSLNFSTKITATPTAYGLVAAQATAYSALHTAFATALAACDPNERSKSLVAAKNSARASLKAQARLLAKLVEGTATVTDAQKLELGLNVKAPPTPVPVPGASPDIDVLSVTGRTVRIRIHEAGVMRRGKPAGVKGSTVFSYVGSTAPTDPAAWKFEGNTTKNIVDIQFPEAVAPGAQVWITAFWFNTKSQSGPACPPVTTNLQFGTSLAA